MAEQPVGIQELANREHIGPTKTGDNIPAKRSAMYGFGADLQWLRIPLPLVDLAFDYVGFSNPDGNGNYQTLSFKAGGSGGTLQRTLTLTFDGSNNVTSIARS